MLFEPLTFWISAFVFYRKRKSFKSFRFGIKWGWVNDFTFFWVSCPFNQKYRCSFQIKSNQITFIVTSPQHKCLGEWNSWERAPDSAKKQTKQFTYRQYIFTDCTEDNVQNTHTHTQYTQCTIKTYLVTNTHSTLCTHLYIVICEGATDYTFTTD